MNIPPGWGTIPQYVRATGIKESTVRYHVRKGHLPRRTVKVEVTIVPLDAKPSGLRVKAD